METKAKMLDAAITLMSRAGFAGVGINAIVKQSGAPKGSLYHFFPDGKRQLAREAIATYAQRILAIFDASLASAEHPGEKINALFRTVAQRLERGNYEQSCTVGAVSLDLNEDLEVVRVAAAGAFAAWIALIAKHFRIEDEQRRRAFAGLVLTALQGCCVRGRAERSSQAFSEAAMWLAALAEREVARGGD